MGLVHVGGGSYWRNKATDLSVSGEGAAVTVVIIMVVVVVKWLGVHVECFDVG